MIIGDYFSGVSKYLHRYLKIEDYPEESKEMISIYFLFSGLMYGGLQLTTAFYVIYILGIVGFAKYGILISASLVFQALVDFPSSVIADWLGRKFVLIFAYIMHGISFLLLALISYVPSDLVLPYLFGLFILEAIALAQESGVLQSWFDTNYKINTKGLDPKREHYRLIFGKTIIFIRFFSSFSVLLGGRLADTISREAVFAIQSIAMFAIAVMIFLKFQEIIIGEKSIVPIEVPRPSFKRFLVLLFGGIKLIFRSKLMVFFFLTYIIVTVVNFVWLTFIFIPLNYAYTGSDPRAAILYFSIFFSGSISTYIGVILSRKINITKSLPFIIAMQGLLYYGLYALLLSKYPIDLETSSINYVAAFFFFVISVFGLILNTVWMIASQRILIDIVPDENRNSFYSMLPTISLLLSSIVAFFMGRFIQLTENLALTIVLFLFTPIIVASFTGFLAVRNYREHEQLHDPIFNYIAGTEEISGTFSLLNLPKHWKSEKMVTKSWMKLMQVAEEDGVVTSDEQLLLRQIVGDLQSYSLLLEEALSDNIIDKKEREGLLAARNTLLQNARIIGEIDDNVSDEEKAIIMKLQTILSQFERSEREKYIKKKKKSKSKKKKRKRS
ncbi:MAG: MFS transporter [Candidatus Heimdallarchaeota archaeon]|nr:MFS transporter [Candidatus Heimdallarchaeota archaeon]